MKRFAPLALLSILFIVSCSDVGDPLGPLDERNVAPAASSEAPVYLVFFGDGVEAHGAARGLARANGFAPRFVWDRLGGFSAVIPAARLDVVRNDPRVRLVEPNEVIQLAPPDRPRGNAPPWCNDPANAGHPACVDEGDGGGGGGNQVTPWGVTRVGGAGNGAGERVYVIDTGVDLDHPDLNVDPSCSANFVTRGKSSFDDGNGHGTHVAGTIAAIDNGADVVGVAAGATICSVRVLDNGGSGTFEWVINGVEFVAGRSGTRVANMSLGANTSNTSLDQAVLAAAGNGVRFALAAGNDGADAEGHSPSRVNHTNVYTISAIGQDDCLTSWSNWGDPVDRAAPGSGILSTKKGGGTTTMSGTSMAAPHVAALLALGNVGSDGLACGDPDGDRDPIAHH
jgi:subtilisin family serine protease